MNIRRVLAVIALVLAVLSFVPVHVGGLPLLPLAVLLLAIALVL